MGVGKTSGLPLTAYPPRSSPPEEFPMAHAAQTKAEAASKPPDEVSPPDPTAEA